MKRILTFSPLAVIFLVLIACGSPTEYEARVDAEAYSAGTAIRSAGITRDMCMNDPGYWALGYRNLGQCLRFVQTGTGAPPTVTDADGNVYPIVRIGNQWWMAENLKTTIYSDGTPIPYFDPETHESWNGYYVWYDDDSTHASVYGALYSMHTVNADDLCPIGWRVPVSASKDPDGPQDWWELGEYLGDYDDGSDGWVTAGGKMKTTGTVADGDGLWAWPNAGATNDSGWSGVPGGGQYRYAEYPVGYPKEPAVVSHGFEGMGSYGYWQVADKMGLYSHPMLSYENDLLSWEATGRTFDVDRQQSRIRVAVSVRCMRD